MVFIHVSHSSFLFGNFSRASIQDFWHSAYYSSNDVSGVTLFQLEVHKTGQDPRSTTLRDQNTQINTFETFGAQVRLLYAAMDYIYLKYELGDA